MRNENVRSVIQIVILLLTVPLVPCSAEHTRKADLPQQHSYLCSDIGAKSLLRVSADGKVEWEYPVEVCTDVWMLENGNVLFTFGGVKTRGVREVTPDKKTVWEYTTNEEVFGCQRLENGNTLVAECSAKRLIEVDPKGKIVKTIRVESTGDSHRVMRHARKLKNGNYLVSFLTDKAVREYDPSGKQIREIKVPDMAFSAVRLKNGNTVIGYRGGVIEVDPKDKVLWHLTQQDIPEVQLFWITAVQRLKNGNTVFNNWFIHQPRPDQHPFIEVTPDKKVVWKSVVNEKMVEPVSIQILDQ
jgi:hypothetical protein